MMTDNLTKAQRSYCMSKIRSKDTKPELILRKSILQKGLKFKIKSDLPGKPDIIFPVKKLVVFVDGCFWHKCPICYKKSKSNKKYWLKKIEGNVRRDAQNKKILKKLGWTVIRIWGHEIKNNSEKAAKKILSSLSR